tara:strand:- start:1743 stop:2489 length:747 start_codon:yes stop_codon:yes gene_type:complete
MKVVILAGGYGTRMEEYTKTIPKPMIKLNDTPIMMKIVSHYYNYGYKDFYIAMGYKYEIIVQYFKKNFKEIKNKSFKNNDKKNYYFYDLKNECKFNLIYTGQNTMTGGRIKRLKKYLPDENFMMTYGDGVSNVNIKKLLKFHIDKKKIVTLTAVNPPARFGALEIKDGIITKFKEKIKLKESWINGGYFVINNKIFEYIKSDKTYFEREPLEKLSKENNLSAYKHNGFWQCMDTKRDKDYLENFYKNK